MKTESSQVYSQITPLQRALLTPIIIIGPFMAILDTTVVDVIIPKIMAPLSTDIYGVQWVITSYMIAAATGLLLCEKIAKAVGLKWIFIVGLILFTSSSFMCGHATSLAEMIFFRTLQGLGESFIVAPGQTMLFMIYPPDKKGFAMGIYSLCVSFAPSLGPTLGGYITEHLSWRFVFYINVPIGILNVIACFFLLPKVLEEKEKVKFNLLSFLLISSATVSLLIFLSKGQEKGWFQSLFILTLFIISLLCFVLYMMSELLSKRSFIDFSIFKIPEFRSGLGMYFFVLGLSMYQIFYILPLYYENLKMFSTLKAGLHIMPMALTVAVFSITSGILSDKLRPDKILIGSGIVLFIAVFLILPKLNYYTPSLNTIFLTIPYGVGAGMFFAPVTTLSLSKLKDKTNLGTSLLHYIRFVGGSFGTAIATNTLQRRIAFHYDEISAMQSKNLFYIKLYIKKWFLLASKMFSPELALKKVKALFGHLTYLQASSLAFQDTFRESSIFVLIGCVFLVIYLFRSKFKSKEAT